MDGGNTGQHHQPLGPANIAHTCHWRHEPQQKPASCGSAGDQSCPDSLEPGARLTQPVWPPEPSHQQPPNHYLDSNRLPDNSLRCWAVFLSHNHLSPVKEAQARCAAGEKAGHSQALAAGRELGQRMDWLRTREHMRRQGVDLGPRAGKVRTWKADSRLPGPLSPNLKPLLLSASYTHKEHRWQAWNIQCQVGKWIPSLRTV